MSLDHTIELDVEEATMLQLKFVAALRKDNVFDIASIIFANAIDEEWDEAVAEIEDKLSQLKTQKANSNGVRTQGSEENLSNGVPDPKVEDLPLICGRCGMIVFLNDLSPHSSCVILSKQSKP